MKDLYPYFHGNWRFDRIVHDHRARVAKQATGQASFTALTETRLLYSEEGSFTDRPLDMFCRSYCYIFEDTNLDVVFADGPSPGQLFQRLHRSASGAILNPVTDHLCGSDCYQGYYTLITQTTFRIVYEVLGPRKDYRMETVYERLRRLKKHG